MSDTHPNGFIKFYIVEAPDCRVHLAFDGYWLDAEADPVHFHYCGSGVHVNTADLTYFVVDGGFTDLFGSLDRLVEHDAHMGEELSESTLRACIENYCVLGENEYSIETVDYHPFDPTEPEVIVLSEQDKRVEAAFSAVPQDIRNDIVEAGIWARNTLRDHEGAGHQIHVTAAGPAAPNMVVCSFAKPEWSGDHCSAPMESGSEAIVMAVCEYLNGA